MLRRATSIGLAGLFAVLLSGCYANGHAPAAEAPAAPRDHAGVGATGSGAYGVVPSAPPGPHEEKDQRGNTPPGMSRDGLGPAGGAIIDPTGAATRGKSY
jgi:hypothetical protein